MFCILQADAQARRNQLMKDMAQLRLQTEVSQLEGSLQSAERPSLPPYLVPEAAVLCNHLNVVKQLAQSARFIIIIPLAGEFQKKSLRIGMTKCKNIFVGQCYPCSYVHHAYFV